MTTTTATTTATTAAAAAAAATTTTDHAERKNRHFTSQDSRMVSSLRSRIVPSLVLYFIFPIEY